MYKVRKSYSTEIRKNRDELNQYIEDVTKAKQKVQEQNLKKNQCKCICNCKEPVLNERVQKYVNRLILKKAGLILRKNKIKNVQGSQLIIKYVEDNIIRDINYRELQLQWHKATFKLF